MLTILTKQNRLLLHSLAQAVKSTQTGHKSLQEILMQQGEFTLDNMVASLPQIFYKCSYYGRWLQRLDPKLAN